MILSWHLPRQNSVFWTIFLSAPNAPPLQSAILYCYCHLAVSDQRKGKIRHHPQFSTRDVDHRSLGHTPSTAGTFRKKFRKNSGKDPGNALRAFPGISLESTAGMPQNPIIQGIRGFQSVSIIVSPPVRAGDASFSGNWFRRGPLRAGHGIPSSTEGISESCGGGVWICGLRVCNARLFSERNPCWGPGLLLDPSRQKS